MPPLPSWYPGPAAIGEFVTDFGFNERRSTELEDQIRVLIDWC